MKNWHAYLIVAPLWASTGFLAFIAGQQSSGPVGAVLCGTATLFCWFLAVISIISVIQNINEDES